MISIKISIFSCHVNWDIERYGFKKISDSPEIYLANHFLTDAECDYIIQKAKPTLTRSTVVDNHSKKSVVDSHRTSLGTFISDPNDPTILSIKNRIESITLLPLRNFESMQVLNYKINAQYKPHYDYFDSKTKGGAHHLRRGGQRVATILLYLNTPEKGGETAFPQKKITVRAIKGRALLFYNLNDQNRPEPNSLHAGLPVFSGEKWIATFWIREHEFN